MGMANIARVRATVTGVAGSPYYLTQYFTDTVGNAQDASDAFRTLLAAAAPMQVTSAVTRMDAAVIYLNAATGQPVGADTVSPGAAITGSGGNSPLPLMTQLGVNLRTGSFQNGRQIQGRFSIPAITEDLNDSGVGPNTTDSSYGTFRDALAALAVSSTVDWVVWSRKAGIPAGVFSATINPMWFTLRSRLH